MVWARARTRRLRRLPRRSRRTPSRRRADPPERNSPVRRPAVVPAFGGSLVPSPPREYRSSHPSEPTSPPPRGANDGRIPSHPTPAPHRFVRRAPIAPFTLVGRADGERGHRPHDSPIRVSAPAAEGYAPPVGRRLPAIHPRSPTSDPLPVAYAGDPIHSERQYTSQLPPRSPARNRP